MPAVIINNNTSAKALEVSSKTKIEDFDNKQEKIKIQLSESKEIIELSMDDYIFGVVASEMPALYHEEALKAQAVAAYTFTLKRIEENKNEDYDITDDISINQSYSSAEELKKRWGENAAVYTEKIKKAVSDTSGQKLVYDGEIITAVYHAISSGKTENSEEIWSKKLPYLQSVQSEWDKEEENFKSSISVTDEEFKKALSSVTFSGDKNDYIKDITKTSAGSVKSLKICNKTFSGEEIRKLFSLRSANFEITPTDSGFTFNVSGYGHGVGMSQTGANYLAKEGKTYKEILAHYYKGAEIK